MHTHIRSNIRHKEVIVCMYEVNKVKESNKSLRFKFKSLRFMYSHPLDVNDSQSNKSEDRGERSTSHECIALAIRRPNESYARQRSREHFVGQILKVLETENEKCAIESIPNEYNTQKRN